MFDFRAEFLIENFGLVAVDYLLIGFGFEILEVVGFIDD